MAQDCFNVTAIAGNETEPEPEDTAAGRVSEMAKYCIMDIAIPCVCGLGLVGNLLSLMVLTTEKLHRTLTKMEISAHIGLMALAVSDFLFCLLVLIFTQASLKPYYEGGDSMIYFDFLANGLITVFIISSTWLIVVMAAERYIAVCHPLRARKLISLRRTRASIVLVFVGCALATIPIFLERRIEEAACYDGRTVYRLVQNSEHSVKLRRILWAICFDFIPCAALVYFNLCLIVQIRRAKKLRDQMTPKHSIIKYTATGTTISAQRMTPAQNTALRKQQNGLYVQRHVMKNPRHNKSYVSGTDENSRQSHSNNKRDSKTAKYFVAFPKDGHQSSKSSCEPRSHSSDSTDNEFRALNENVRSTRRQSREGRNGSTGYSRSKTDVCSVSRRRPSDSALNSVTATLVAVVLLFLILVSPSELLKFSLGYTLSDKNQKQIVTYVTNFMQVLNFSLNFVLYCAVNKTFRHTLHGLICCCWLSLRG